MRLPSHPDFHLTYCTNIHPADGWDNVRETLGRYAPALRARFAPGCRARRGAAAVGSAMRAGLLAGRNLQEFRAFLDAEGLYVAIINGFPYGPFHGTPVKASVYAPDWRDPARVAYTLDLIRILAALLPAGLDGGVSTAPMSYKPWMAAAGRWSVGGDRRSCGADRGGARPDPAGDGRRHSPRYRARARLLHREHRRDPRLLRAAAAADRRAPARPRPRFDEYRRRPRRAARAHPGVLRLLSLRGGVRTTRPRRSIASAPPGSASAAFSSVRRSTSRCRRMPGAAADVVARLRPFADTTYLHQVVERRAVRVAPLSRSRRRARRARRASSRGAGGSIFTCRCSPASTARFGSTQAYVAEVLEIRDRAPTSRAISRSKPTPGTCCRAASRWISSSRSAANTTGCCTPAPRSPAPPTAVNAEDRRPQRRRPDRRSDPPRRAASGAVGAIGGARADRVRIPRRHLHRAVRLPDRPSPRRARRRRQRLVCAGRVRGAILAAVEPAGAGAEDLGDGARRAIRRSPAPTCSGGSTCIRRPTISVTPRPMYPADGRKLPDVYSHPAALRDRAAGEARDVSAVRLLGSAGVDRVHPLDRRRRRSWSRSKHPADADAGLSAASRLQPAAGRPGIAGGAGRCATGRRDLRRPDRVLRGPRRRRDRALRVRHPRRLAPGAHQPGAAPARPHRGARRSSAASCSTPAPAPAFAVADHQIAHVYVNDPARIGAIRAQLEHTAGIERVLDAGGKQRTAIDHPRSGELVAIAEPDAWFTYYYWLDDERAPDFARTVDIHRKPGYDPVELFLDPAIRIPALTVGWKLAQTEARLPNPARRDSARRLAGEGIARPPRRPRRSRCAGLHHPSSGPAPLDQPAIDAGARRDPGASARVTVGRPETDSRQSETYHGVARRPGRIPFCSENRPPDRPGPPGVQHLGAAVEDATRPPSSPTSDRTRGPAGPRPRTRADVYCEAARPL